jgi:pyocin large subunit-like protein
MRPGVRWLAALALLLGGCEADSVPRDAPAAPSPASAPAAAPTPVAAASPAPTAPPAEARQSVGFRTPRALAEHYDKHGAEFRAASPRQYLALAQALRDRPAGGDVLEIVRDDGVITRFDRASGAFIAFERDGVIRTFFIPNDGERYFQRQAKRQRR